MHATEHSDRFTVVLPNGQPMDVFKADLRPETAAELRSMVVPAMATRGDVTGAELDAIEEQAKELEGESAPMSTPATQMSVLAQLAQDDIAAQQSSPSLAVAPEVGQSLPAVVAGPAPQDALPAMPTAAPRPASMLNWSNSLPDSLPGIGLPVAPEMVNMTSALREQPDAVILTPEQAKTAGERGADVPIDVPPPEKGFAARQGAPAAPIAPPTDPDAAMKAKFLEFARGAEAPKSVGQIAPQSAAPFEMPKSYMDAVEKQQKADEYVFKLDSDAKRFAQEQREKNAVIEQQMLDRDNAQRAEETRRLDQMREEAFNGKIDVNRAFDRMDGGQRALSLIGLLLGGIGAGNTGANAAVGVMERMIDRDIDAQAKDLGRKQTAYSNAIQQGYHAEQARQRARLEAMSLLQGAVERAAMKNGSERAIAAGQAASAALGMKLETDRNTMFNQHYARETQRIASEQDREYKNKMLSLDEQKIAAQRYAASMAAFAKMNAPDPKIAALEHVLPDKSVVIASNPTSKAKLEIIQSAHSDMLTKIAEARKLREDYGGGTIAPNSKILRATGLPAAVYADEAASLAGQMELAWLRGEAAGAYDVGSGKKAAEVMPSAADLGEEAFQNKIDRLERIANEKFRAGIVSLVRPASAQRF